MSHNNRLNLIETQKDVYIYVINRLNPFKDISITYEFLKNLPGGKYFSKIDDVIHPLTNLIRDYVKRFIEPWMRVYFAYRIEQPLEILPNNSLIHSDSVKAYYRIGIAYSENDKEWCEGRVVGMSSNIDRVYRKGIVSKVRDARHSMNTRQTQNEQADNEGSVIALPILYGEDLGPSECIGVIGISSPKKEEVTSPEFEALSNELSTIFSALFYAYGQYLQKIQKKSFPDVINQLRSEISEHFEFYLADST